MKDFQKSLSNKDCYKKYSWSSLLYKNFIFFFYLCLSGSFQQRNNENRFFPCRNWLTWFGFAVLLDNLLSQIGAKGYIKNSCLKYIQLLFPLWSTVQWQLSREEERGLGRIWHPVVHHLCPTLSPLPSCNEFKAVELSLIFLWKYWFNKYDCCFACGNIFCAIFRQDSF